MAEITVVPKGGDVYAVAVQDDTATQHTVTVSEDYYQKLTRGNITHEDLLIRSFEFLLDRESNTMIFTRFDLPVITQYFPEYESEITASLKQS